jgi:signal recognition particle receptor subunit beta
MVNLANARPGDAKIVFTGPMGAGKTTAINAVSDGQVMSTEVPISDGATGAKSHTTVGFDYGECQLEGGHALRLFGTPGQERFRFMWDILGAGALGLVVLIDNTRPDPIGDVEHYVRAFAARIPPERMVVGVGRLDQAASPSIEDYCERLARIDTRLPVLEVDVRRAQDVRLLLSVLVSLVEVQHE